MCLLEGKVLRNISRTFPKMVLFKTKQFWSMMKPFLTNEDHNNGEEIILKCDNQTITESSMLAEMFNSHYMNIVEKTSGSSQVILLVIIMFLILDKL